MAEEREERRKARDMAYREPMGAASGGDCKGGVAAVDSVGGALALSERVWPFSKVEVEADSVGNGEKGGGGM